MAIWVTSDLHLNHPDIIKSCRPQFSTTELHDEYVISRFNSVVGKDDLIYILGDVGFTPYIELKDKIKKLNGRKILILGNHDILNPQQYASMGFIEVINHPVYYSPNIILSHIPIQEALNNPWVYNIHGHIHQGTLNLKNYINVNIESSNFLPVNLKGLQQQIASFCRPTRYEPFQQEWYSKWEQKCVK